MARSTEENLLEVIKKDDKKAFDDIANNTRLEALRLGRFPVLSLLYLFKSRKILSAYESRFIKVNDWQELSEPAELSVAFSKKAGKCLRLYIDEVVSPLEMLLILDKISRLKRIYPAAKPSNAVKERLKAIYSIKYSLGVKYEGGNVILDRRPLSRREKKKIITACVCSFLAVAIAVAAPITAVKLTPQPVEGEVTKLEQIDFKSKKTYTLKKDLHFPDNFSVDKINCKIDGGGKKVSFGQGACLGELNGKIENLTIECSQAVFTTVSENATVENVTINVNADVTAEKSSSFFANVNYGLIDGVTLNVGGKLSADGGTEEEVIFGGLVQTNGAKTNAVVQKNYFGTVKNCTVNYTDFSLDGATEANAVFGGVAGINQGYLQDCEVSGAITSLTVDLGGLCAYNEGEISNCVNSATLSQTASVSGWSPIVCGIAVQNGYYISNCKNAGALTSVSDCQSFETEFSVAAAGITYINAGEISVCKNEGALKASGGVAAYVGGITVNSYSLTSYCISAGEIEAASEEVYVGGIMACSLITRDYYSYYFGVTQNCISENKITVQAENNSFVGGIAGFIQQGSITGGEETVYVGGGVTDCYFTGEVSFAGNYAGSIVGVVGADLYNNNSYVSGNTEYFHFKGNYYVAGKAFGAVVSSDNEFAAVEDIGAKSADLQTIQSGDGYKNILSKFEK